MRLAARLRPDTLGELTALPQALKYSYSDLTAGVGVLNKVEGKERRKEGKGWKGRRKREEGGVRPPAAIAVSATGCMRCHGPKRCGRSSK